MISWDLRPFLGFSNGGSGPIDAASPGPTPLEAGPIILENTLWLERSQI
jgi:hypothetical protein